MDLKKVTKDIENLRKVLEDCITKNEANLSDFYIISLSQKLDKLINTYNELAVTKKE